MSWQNFLDGADGLVNIYSKIKETERDPVEATAPVPAPDRLPVETNTGFQGFGQYGLQSSIGVVGLIAFVYLLATR